MATIITPANVTIDPAADGALVAAAFTSHECAYCLSPIVSEQRWVREKIYEPSTGNGPRYRRYHADLFADEELSCWEKRVMELEIARTARTAVRVHVNGDGHPGHALIIDHFAVSMLPVVKRAGLNHRVPR